MKAAWASARDDSRKSGGGFDINVEDGPYVARLSDANVREGGESMGLVLEFTIIQGADEAIGEKLPMWLELLKQSPKSSCQRNRLQHWC